MLAPWATVLGYAPAFLAALWLTASMSVLAFGFAFVLGILGALARRSAHPAPFGSSALSTSRRSGTRPSCFSSS